MKKNKHIGILFVGSVRSASVSKDATEMIVIDKMT